MLNKLKQLFLKELEILNYSEHSLRAYKHDLDTLRGAKRDNILDALEGLSPRSKQRRLFTYKKFFRFAKENGLDKNPAENINNIRVPKKLPDIPDLDLSIVDKISSQTHKVILKLLVEVGLRASEFSKLTKKDLVKDKNGYWLRVLEAKGNKDRLVPIAETTHKLLKIILDSGYEFPKSRGIYYVSKQYFNVSPHAVRRFCFTRLSEKGISPFILMKIAGWSSIQVAESYVNVSQESVWQEFSKCLEQP